MPRTAQRSAPGLTVEIDRPDRSYFMAGDTLTGFVVLDLTKVTFFHSVRLQLYGRAKTKITKSNGTRCAIYRSRRVLFNIQQTLHIGQVDCGSGEHAWRFAIQIPNHPASGQECGDELAVLSTTPAYLATEGGITQHALPTTFNTTFERKLGFVKAEGYIEYYLRVVVFEKGKPKASMVCTKVLFLRARSTDEPAEDFKTRPTEQNCIVRSIKLHPSHADNPPPTRTTLERVLQPSKRTQHALNFHITHPTIIQLDHPNPLPFAVSVEPTPPPTSTSGPLEIRLTNLRLFLQSTTRVRAPSIFGETHKVLEYELTSKRMDHMIPTHTPLNLTNFLDIHVHRTLCARAPGELFKQRPLFSSFKTYNIAVSYELCWELKLDCAGQVVVVKTGKGEGQACEVLDTSEADREKQDVVEGWAEGRVGRDWEGHIVVTNTALRTVNIVLNGVSALT
ncbi:uncharacterized protein BDZ99DRAFT_99821 [Mytilinidion resinicola]|uniref:Arrestin-like N-terminal domain-containing protein n=1 Tax=Mytilinidion resinicola TaxID=574789 RepID=A0A6A6YAK2_9PEZI|nr:uncharacterized protein BDZ99DRAFT_99821 [Mytilinidion resinicola]KAF2805852.1 hypothetical protein BDZ99DRAFT_99821 [Mytilinidion resinicola]